MSVASDCAPGAEPEAMHRPGFARLCWAVLGYTLLVILFGAVVRITGSGAGCGQHWPTCQGEVVHLPRTVETAIELGHRLTSGVSGLLVFGLAILAFRQFPPGASTRRAASLAVVFMIVEALIGAALVRLRLVERDASVARAVVMSLHLVNTSFLTATLALTAWTAARPSPARWRPRNGLEWALVAALLAVLAVSVTGAVTALGDTLFPVNEARSVAERLAADHDPAATFLERGRAVHPVVAVLAAALVVGVARRVTDRRSSSQARRVARLVSILVAAQIAAGLANVWLSAPAWMQLLHLALATVLWIGLVLLYTAVRADASIAT